METDKVFAGPVPQLYDRHLGPTLFRPFADLLAGRLGEADRDILETAAGTGIVTRALAAALPRSRIVATDLNPAMLAVAAAEAPSGRVTWQQADALSLPFEPGSFDAVVCSFGMMFMPDKQAASREVLRVLRPHGRFIFTVWDRIESNPLMQVADTTVAGLYPANPPHFLARTPCGYTDRASIERDAREAGFTSVSVEEIRLDTNPSTARESAMGLCQGTPLRGEIEARDPDGLAGATDAVAEAMQNRFGGGSFRTPMQALVVTASRG
jgi:ubiquinone/menaquinone biosynthesis C-methylase UbiE